MFQLVSLELYKLFTKSRSWIALSAILFIVVAVIFAMYSEGGALMGMGTQSLQSDPAAAARAAPGSFNAISSSSVGKAAGPAA